MAFLLDLPGSSPENEIAIMKGDWLQAPENYNEYLLLEDQKEHLQEQELFPISAVGLRHIQQYYAAKQSRYVSTFTLLDTNC